MPGRRPVMTNGWGSRLSFDLGEVGDGKRRGADAVQEPQAILAQAWIVGVDGDVVEEGVDWRAELCYGGHCSLEIFFRDRSGSHAFDFIHGLSQRLFLSLFEQLGVRRLIVALIVLLLLDAQNVDRALGASEQMLAVLGVEEAAERLYPAHEHKDIILISAFERKYGIDQIVSCTLLTQLDFEAVSHELQKCRFLRKYILIIGQRTMDARVFDLASNAFRGGSKSLGSINVDAADIDQRLPSNLTNNSVQVTPEEVRQVGSLFILYKDFD